MRARVAVAVGTALVASGVVWMLQGMGSRYAPSSFMTGSREWILIGALAVAAGIWLIVVNRRRL